MKVYTNIFSKIVSKDNLCAAWKEFRKDKKNRRDVIEFAQDLDANISKLNKDLILRRYRHGQYRAFFIHDPKQRKIHKATVRDRILHHAVFNVLNPIFEPTFIADSFSCRVGKGTHKAVDRLEKMCRRNSRNSTQNCFALKCDIRKFFGTVDHNKLLEIIERRVEDKDAMTLIVEIVKSFWSQYLDLFRYRFWINIYFCKFILTK